MSNTEIVVSPDTTAERDFQLARENLLNILVTGGKALDELSQIAAAARHPSVYRVISELIQTLSNANEGLMRLQQDRADLNGEKDSGDVTINAANAVFAGSTAELLEFVKAQRLLKNSDSEVVAKYDTDVTQE